MNHSKLISRFIIGTFVTLYLLVSTISTIHVIDFFEMSNPYWLAVTLAIAFEVGAAASLASLIVLDKMNKGLIWALFIVITLMQMQGNMYYAFKNLGDYQAWAELFNLIEEDPLYQKRILSFVSGAILPLVALGFIKSLVDYIKPSEEKPNVVLEDNVESMRKIVEAYDDLEDEIKEWEEASLVDLQNFDDFIEEKQEIKEKKEDLLESKIEKTTEDISNDYIFGKQIYQDAINKTAKTNAILAARKAKIESSIKPEISIIEETPIERQIKSNKISSTGARKPTGGSTGMYQ